MKRFLVGVAGAGGFGRETMSIVRSHCARTLSASARIEIVFLDMTSGQELNGHEIWDEASFSRADADEKLFVTAFGDSYRREIVHDRLRASGAAPLSVFAENSIVLEGNHIEEGAVLSYFTMVTTDCTIGRSFQANIYSYVAHDCHIGDYVTFAPGVKCNGYVQIGDHAYIGTGACIKPGQPGKPLAIGAGAIVGMGAVVTRDVPPGVTVVGNPARPMD